MIRVSHLALFALCVIDCKENVAQIVLAIDTDALVPERGGALGPIFDTLRVDVFRPDEREPSSSRTFSLDAQRFRDRGVSFGVAPRPGTSGYRVRVRMYPSFASLTDTPPANATIEAVLALPPIAAAKIVDLHTVLHVDDVGVPRGTLDAPTSAEPGRVTSSLVGTWAGAARVPCSSDPQPGEVCVPGGAFWMGSATQLEVGLSGGADELRLVVLSPFFLDATEVTAGAFRATGLRATLWSGKSDGENANDWCSLTANPSDRDALPINCVTQAAARVFCRQRGATLPTEAQFEYAAGALENRLYVWGSDPPGCDDAILQRGGYGILYVDYQECKPSAPPGGPSPPGSGALDKLVLRSGVVFDLVGNVNEWTLDQWNRQGEPCWSARGVYHDPVCTTPSTLDAVGFSVRGGTFFSSPQASAAAVRGAASGTEIATGFRCARPDP